MHESAGLLLEQELLIKELRLMQTHLEQLEEEIYHIVEYCREGKILLSIPPVTPLAAATILATIGHIANFEDAGHLKSYFGWAPKGAQTGVSFDWEREIAPRFSSQYLVIDRPEKRI